MTQPGSAGFRVTRNDEASRFEGRLDGELVAIADFVETGRSLTMTHTEVLPAHENQGLATTLVDAAFRDARERGLRIVPACSFVRLHARRHAEDFADVLAPR
ncbi:GNAT family N-acetyltransferase [Kineococcus gynurae]|uniref:GNAT family N-acetyltransferase n=1 Tax=Kineococcus gynurae TaxID=452979 RepID=A0ABV5LPP0_9ACTN